MRAFCLMAALVSPVRAQIRVETAPMIPRVEAVPVAPAPAAAMSISAFAPFSAPLSASAPTERASALGAGIARALSAPPAAPPDSPEELAHAAGAPARLASRADDLAGERGLKARSARGAEFLALVDEARARADAEEAAPSAASASAAAEVRAALSRVLRALIDAERPLMESLSRASIVWQTMGQEMEAAAKGGTLAAIRDDARLFAEQVEASVPPAAPPAIGLRASEHPEDAEGYSKFSQRGSVFGWRPIKDSPGHGSPALDALIRFALTERAPRVRAGFEIPGAPSREEASVYFYGERHTDGALIAANMRRLAEDARPGKPIIVLVEGYTGRTLRGYEALRYLAARGLDPQSLAAKGVVEELVTLRGWDTAEGYDASKRPMFRNHMDLLELNRLAHSDLRGRRYYRDFARAALTAWRSRRELQRLALVARNGDLDAAVARSVRDADASGATVHVIAGSDHLMESPRLSALLAPLVRPAFRSSLRAALSGRPFWASMPPASAAP